MPLVALCVFGVFVFGFVVFLFALVSVLFSVFLSTS